MTVVDAALTTVMARLEGSPLADVVTIRRMHLTALDRDDCPALNVMDGDDEAVGRESGCEQGRRAGFVVRIVVRADDGLSDAYDIAEAVLERLDPATGGMTAYPAGARIEFDALRPNAEIADEDAIALDLAFRVSYTARSFRLTAL